LPDIPARRPNGPGRFAFADRRRVRHILEKSGWAEIDIGPVDVRAACEPYVHGSEVRFNAACWMVGGHAPAS